MIAVAFCVLGALGAVSAPARAAPTAGPRGVELRTETFAGVEIDVVAVDLRRARLRLVWRRANGEALGGLAAARDWLVSQGERPVALTNAGIYGRDDQPLGIHIEDGRELHPLNRGKGGNGNFYLKPNGVFYLDKEGAHISETTEFAKRGGSRKSIRLATQSGPLLVQRGAIHPKVTPDSASALIRNGVCVKTPEEVYLVVTRGGINFHGFARFMRDVLGCADALYLDGSISRLHAPALGRSADGLWGGFFGDSHFVGILAVMEGAKK